jgi:NTE family protein
MGRTAIVMSGGGAKGAFELGAVDYLIRDKKVDPAALIGVSTGNLNAAMLAQGKGRQRLLEQLDELTELWFGIDDDEDIYYRRFAGIIGLFLKADSVYSNKPLWKLIRKHVDRNHLKNSKRILRVGVVGLKSGEYYIVDGSHPRILEMIRASAAIPVFFNPVDISDERYVDGGVRNVTPLNSAFLALRELAKNNYPESDRKPVDTIYVILASPLKQTEIEDDNKLDSGLEIAQRSLELLVNEIYVNDLQLAATINDAIRYHEKLKKKNIPLPKNFPFKDQKCVNLVVIQPEKLHMGSLEFDPAKIREAFRSGRRRARKACSDAEAGRGSNIDRNTYARKLRLLKRK